ncbi:MAG: hypothetical protein ACI84K_001745, partial [Pseudohongiellaceae bacterium]
HIYNVMHITIRLKARPTAEGLFINGSVNSFSNTFNE